MKKRFLSAGLAVVMAASLTACGGSGFRIYPQQQLLVRLKQKVRARQLKAAQQQMALPLRLVVSAL